jgi:tetratricopeptide (TPR) repeat protein
MAHQVRAGYGVLSIAVLLGEFALAGLLAGPLCGDEPAAGTTTQTQASVAELETRIATLIQQLGAGEYATRERAQAELRRLRLDAFDALNEAQFNDDIEIAMSARYLVRSMQVTWVSEDDAPEVKQLLRGYGDRPESERRGLVDQLALLGADQALRPLCRLVRYEASEALSKHAALLIMGFAAPADDEARRPFLDMLQGRMGTSRRTAANWLRAYVALLNNDPAATGRWQELVDQEQTRLVDTPDQTSREIARDLLKWFADQLTHRNQPEQALAVMRKMTNLLNSTPQEVLDAVDWFRQRKSWRIVVEIAAQFPETFKRSPLLLYRLAETYSQLGDSQKAEETARQAMQVTPEEWDKHLELAAVLEHDGLFESAEREYRYVAKAAESEPVQAVRAKFYLSEMLHALHQDQAAGDVLKDVLDTLAAGEDLAKLVESDLGRKIGPTRSRMCFFYAEHEARQGNTARQRELLLEGYQHDPLDADLLIAMYRMPQADEVWKQETRQRINKATEDYRGQIKELQEQAGAARQADDRAITALQLALMNNQLAWLAANTEGDADEAIRCSLQSLALAEDRPGFLDTLGRCYYAKGDFASAVKYQTRAVALDPHSPSMAAQLELFQKALQKQEAAKVPGGDSAQTP